MTQPCSRMPLKYQGEFGEEQEVEKESDSSATTLAGAGQPECRGYRLRLRHALRRGAAGPRPGASAQLQDVH